MSKRATWYSFLYTILLIGSFLTYSGGWGELSELPKIITDPSAITQTTWPTGLVLAGTIASIFVMLASGKLCRMLLPEEKGKHLVYDFLGGFENDYNFLKIFSVVLIEEIVTRWLFLGVLPAHLNSSEIVLYFLIYGSNLAWAAVHLWNYEAVDRNFFRVMPQFLGGLVNSFVFLKAGLMAAVLTHFAVNSLLLCSHKVEDGFEQKDSKIAKYSFAMVVSGLICLGIKDINYYEGYPYSWCPYGINVEWESGSWNSIFQLFGGSAVEGWGTMRYFAASVVVIYALKFLSIWGGFDQGCVEKNGSSVTLPKPWEVVLGVIASACLLAGGYYLMGIFSDNLQFRAVLLTLLLGFFCPSSSGSSVARQFWTLFPSIYLMICIGQILEPLAFLQLLSAHALVRMPLFSMERA